MDERERLWDLIYSINRRSERMIFVMAIIAFITGTVSGYLIALQ